jgi:hypothetical protein
MFWFEQLVSCNACGYGRAENVIDVSVGCYIAVETRGESNNAPREAERYLKADRWIGNWANAKTITTTAAWTVPRWRLTASRARCSTVCSTVCPTPRPATPSRPRHYRRSPLSIPVIVVVDPYRHLPCRYLSLHRLERKPRFLICKPFAFNGTVQTFSALYSCGFEPEISTWSKGGALLPVPDVLFSDPFERR